MKRLIAAVAIGFALAIPAQALATTTARVTAIVKAGYTKQIRARASLAGFRFVSDTVKCASIGSQRWTCYATYTITKSGAYAKYGIYIGVTRDGWKTQGSAATLLKEW